MNNDQQPGGFGMDNNHNEEQQEKTYAWNFEEKPQGSDPFAPPPVQMPSPAHALGVQRGRTSRTVGITGVVLSVVCCCLPVVGLVLGIIAVVQAQLSKKALGQTTPEASVGLVCGIIAIVLSAVFLILDVVARFAYGPDIMAEYQKRMNEILPQME